MKKFLTLFAFTIMIVFASAIGHHFSKEVFTLSTMSFALFAPVVSVERQRFSFDRLKKIAQKLGQYGMGKFIVNEDYFRSEQPLVNGTTNYSFLTWQKQMQQTANNYPLQQGIADKDLFIGISMGFYLDNRVLGSSKVRLQSYPNSTAFGTNTADYTTLYQLYNGVITFSVDRTVYIPRISTTDFLFQPVTQQSSDANVSSFDLRGTQKHLDPYILMSGANTNEINLNIYGDAVAAGTNNTQNVATVYMLGFTVQSGADWIDAFSDFDSWLLTNAGNASSDAQKADTAIVASGGNVLKHTTSGVNSIQAAGGIQLINQTLQKLGN